MSLSRREFLQFFAAAVLPKPETADIQDYHGFGPARIRKIWEMKTSVPVPLTEIAVTGFTNVGQGMEAVRLKGLTILNSSVSRVDLLGANDLGFQTQNLSFYELNLHTGYITAARPRSLHLNARYMIDFSVNGVANTDSVIIAPKTYQHIAHPGNGLDVIISYLINHNSIVDRQSALDELRAWSVAGISGQDMDKIRAAVALTVGRFGDKLVTRHELNHILVSVQPELPDTKFKISRLLISNQPGPK